MADGAKVVGTQQIVVPRLEGAPALEAFRLVTKDDPDIAIPLIAVGPAGTTADALVLTTAVPLDARAVYRLEHLPSHTVYQIAPSLFGTLCAILLTAALVQNFVFTRYLGLCVFFGVSRRRETAIGMGVTFTIVGTLSGLLAWVVDRLVLHPLTLHFLQIIVFIGIVACLVQMADTTLRKTHRALHKKFGIYVVLITTNCIILAVPLLNAMNQTGPWESLALALGSGVGFALALFLMSCARERVDLAPVPRVFQGLPIAFILAGLFALAFLGFSGLTV